MHEKMPVHFPPIRVHAPLNELDVPDGAREIAEAGQDVPHEALTSLLEQPDSARIALYVPEQWLPGAAAPRYREAFLDAWWSLLGQVDQRADFVDGDIGELGGETVRPMVNKAAHMGAMLVRHGLLTDAELDHIVQQTDGEVLRASIVDAQSRPQSYLMRNTDISQLREEVLSRSQRPEDSPARQRWLRAQLTDEAVREAARVQTPRDVERPLGGNDAFEMQVALQGLARLVRQGLVSPLETTHIAQAYDHASEPEVRTRSARLLRHLYHAGMVERDVLESRGIELPRLAGALSENLPYDNPDVLRLQTVVAEMMRDPILSRNLYPVVAVGGSRLKGYGETSADLDTVVFFRPEAEDRPALQGAIARVFSVDRPVEAHLTATAPGLRLPDEEAQVGHVASDWSHVLYSMMWIGDDETVQMLRQELSAGYQTDRALRHLALRRLEQDSLQYRLMHKGYERHYAVHSDDVIVPSDAIDSQSVYWDPGYRRLATQLFAEKVRLPRVK